MTRASTDNAAAAMPQKVRRQALEWQVTFWSGEVTAAEQSAFRQWLAADPAHEHAWRDVQRVDGMLAAVPASLGGRVLRQPKSKPERRRTVLRVLGWLAAGGVLSLSVRETPQWQTATAGYRTRTGERRDIVLEDGTRVCLNTATAIDVRFDGERRVVVLHDGEILVDTAPDTLAVKRPFIVQTRHGSLQALGTRFSVRREEQGIEMAVYEGAVEIRPRNTRQQQRVAAGQQTRFDADAIDAVVGADPLDAAWTKGLLVAERMRLSDFLLRLERHRPGVLRCDPEVAGLVVSGVYPLEDTDRVLAALAEALPVRVEHATRYWVAVRAR